MEKSGKLVGIVVLLFLVVGLVEVPLVSWVVKEGDVSVGVAILIVSAGIAWLGILWIFWSIVFWGVGRLWDSTSLSRRYDEW